MEQRVEQIEIAGLRLDLHNQRLEHQGRIVNLRPKSWELLKYMVARPAQLLGKDELVQAVWGDTVVTDASLNQVVRELRKALGDDARSPRYIETVHRRGFRFLLGANEAKSSGDTGAESSHRPGLFGRDQELNRLQQLSEAAAAGQSQFCFVTGEPGIGKTSLVQEFLETLHVGPRKHRSWLGAASVLISTVKARPTCRYWKRWIAWPAALREKCCEPAWSATHLCGFCKCHGCCRRTTAMILNWLQPHQRECCVSFAFSSKP